MLKPLFLLIGLAVTANACSEKPDVASELSSIPESLLKCLKGADCTPFRVANTHGEPEFSFHIDRLWNNYADGTAEEAKALIGGNADASWITNTCVLRLSRSLNYAGYEIPLNYPPYNGMLTVKGGDNKRYGVRVKEMAQYLLARYGAPTVIKTEEDSAIRNLNGNSGIILYDLPGGQTFDGHFDLWQDNDARHEDYQLAARNVFLWL